MKIKVRVREFEEEFFIVPNTKVDNFDNMVEDYLQAHPHSPRQDEILEEFENYFGQYRSEQDEIQLFIDSKDR